MKQTHTFTLIKDQSTIDNRLSFTGTPLTTPTATSPHILVVGGGVASHITSWVLLDAGYRATILSKERASYGKEQRITSQIAGALWEFPPALCVRNTKCVDAYELLAPITDTDKAMSWLTKLVTHKEAKRIPEAIHGDPLDCEENSVPGLMRTSLSTPPA
ncbi:hypothetical protein ACMFMG_004754 [Clarireedia jacksonii]